MRYLNKSNALMIIMSKCLKQEFTNRLNYFKFPIRLVKLNLELVLSKKSFLKF